jgi:hypothetical protein
MGYRPQRLMTAVEAHTLATVTPLESCVADEIGPDRAIEPITRREALRRVALFGVFAGGVDLTVACAAVDDGDLVLNFVNYGRCDGTANDADAFKQVIGLLSSAGGGLLQLPPATIAMTLTAWPMFTVPGNVRVVGAPGMTTIILTSDSAIADRAFIATSGDKISIEGVKFVRNADFPLVFFFPGAIDSFRFSHCEIDGQRDTYATHYAHGISLDGTGEKSHIALSDSRWTRLDYPLFQGTSTNSSDHITVDNCTFAFNYADDLCFNAPNANMSNVSVTRCRFVDNQSTDPSRGFGVDFAHVTGGTVSDSYFENYYNEGIHIEDYSTNIVISGNRLVSCGTTLGGGMTVVTGCTNVSIVGNTVDASANTTTLHAIAILAGGNGTTPGGRPMIAPSRCTLSNNIIRCGAKYLGIYAEAVPDVTVVGNHIDAAGTVVGGFWDDANVGTAINMCGVRTLIGANTITGFRYGITGPANTWDAAGDTGSVTGNAVSDCYLGIVAVTAATLDISSNVLHNCVRPMVVGAGGSNDQPCTVTANFALRCVYGFEINGTLLVIRPGSYSAIIGTQRTIDVIDNFLPLPVGAVINFAGGGILTLTREVPLIQQVGPYPYPLTGDITGAAINAYDVGTLTDLPNFTVSTNNRVDSR